MFFIAVAAGHTEERDNNVHCEHWKSTEEAVGRTEINSHNRLNTVSGDDVWCNAQPYKKTNEAEQVQTQNPLLAAAAPPQTTAIYFKTPNAKKQDSGRGLHLELERRHSVINQPQSTPWVGKRCFVNAGSFRSKWGGTGTKLQPNNWYQASIWLLLALFMHCNWTPSQNTSSSAFAAGDFGNFGSSVRSSSSNDSIRSNITTTGDTFQLSTHQHIIRLFCSFLWSMCVNKYVCLLLSFSSSCRCGPLLRSIFLFYWNESWGVWCTAAGTFDVWNVHFVVVIVCKPSNRDD